MSHFSRIKTIIKDIDLLKKTLSDLSIKWEENASEIRGYRNQKYKADIVINQNNNIDIGFCWNNNSYELMADIAFWDQPVSIDRYLNKINHRYAFNKILEQTTKSGFELVNQNNNIDGSTTIVLEKWN
jgi:hypothetical protein